MSDLDDGNLFDYSDSEWAAIEAALQVVLNGALPDRVREFLQTAARGYRWSLTQPKPNEILRHGANIYGQIADLQDAFSHFGKLYLGIDDSCVKFKQQVEEQLDNLLQVMKFFYFKPAHASATKIVREFNPKYKFDSWQHYRYAPRLIYFSTLELWWRLGGKLRFSRHPKSGEISGPLARYFFAVTGPVMGASTPKPETLRDIIKWFKVELSKLKVNGESIDLTRTDPPLNGEAAV